MFWIVVLPVIVALTLWFAYLKPYSHWTNRGIKQTKPWFIFGDSWPTFFRKINMLEWEDWIYYMHPESRYTGMYQFYNPGLFLKDPDLIKQVTVKDFDYFTDHNAISVPEEVDALWSKNLVFLEGQRWRDIRALLSGSFTSSKMRTMYTLISETSGNFVKYFLNKNQDFLEVEMKDNFTRYTNDVIASTSFGIKVNSLEDPKNAFYLMGKQVSTLSFTSMLKIFGYMFCPRLLKALRLSIFSIQISKFFMELINETIRVREEQGIVRPDMINILLEVKKGTKGSEEKEVIDTGFAVVQESSIIAKRPKRHIEITNTDIASQAMSFFVAGFDSVATAMSFACHELAVNPDVQDKLRREIQETLEGSDGKITYETLLKMKYLDMVVSETLRKWPIAGITDRVCVRPYTLEPSNPGEPTIHFKKGEKVWIPMFSIHRDLKYYPDPEKFNPDRFSDENKGNIKPYTYLPFGVGPRACIGSRFALLEIKSVLFQMLNNFEIVPVEKTMIPMEISRKSFIIIPDGGFPLGLRRLYK